MNDEMRTVWKYLIFLLPAMSLAQVEQEYKVLEKSEAITIAVENGQLRIHNDIYEKAEFLNDNLLYLARQSIPFDSFTKIEALDAYTEVDGTKRAVDHFEDRDQIKGIFFYSDSKTRDFTFPAVRKGAVTHMKYRETYSNDIPFSQAFVFGSYFPVEKASISVTFPPNVTLGYAYFNAENFPIEFTKEEGRKSNTYTWTATNTSGYQLDNTKNESALYYLPHLIVYVKEVDGKPVLRSVEDLYGWYTTLIDRIDDTGVEEVQSLAEKIVAGKSSQRDKAAAIYNWVQDNITYVAFGDGFGGFVPRGAGSVCQKKYGDCKDMSHVLYVMLRHVGLEAYHTWIGSREKPYDYRENPTPIVDDHMITSVVIEGDTLFLDGTDSHVRFGYPSSFIQGKQALIGLSDSEFSIVRVPMVAPEKNVSKVRTVLQMDGENLRAKETRRMSGFEKVALMSDYIYKKGTDSDEEYLNKKWQLGNNKTDYENIVFAGLNNDEDTLRVSFDLLIQNYAKAIGDRIFLNLNIDRTLSNDKIDGMQFSRKFDHAYRKIFHTTFEVPKGYQVTEVPEPLEHRGSDFGFSISYKREEGKVHQYKELYINTLSIAPTDFERWNLFIKDLVRAYKKSIVIQKSI